jgi:rubrerythrin
MSLTTLQSRSEVTDPRVVDAEAFARQPLPDGAVRTLTYMADIEGHTIVYLRELLATRVVDDPDMAAFLACWFYEESAHSRALAAVLEASGHPLRPSPRQARGWRARVEGLAIAAVSAAWPDFVAVHMTWGAINELTTLTAYRRLAAVADHPALAALLGRIARDESRHFGFYYAQAQRRLAASPTTRRVVRALIDRFWAPVGHGVRPDDELGALARYLFGGADGRAAVQRADRTIRRLPGFAAMPLLEAWLDRHGLGLGSSPSR